MTALHILLLCGAVVTPQGGTDLPKAKTPGAIQPHTPPSSKSLPDFDRLAAALQSDDESTRDSAVESLTQLSVADVAPIAQTAMNSANSEVRLAALKILRHVPRTGPVDMKLTRSVCRDLARVLGTDRVDENRREACHVLAEWSPDGAVVVLCKSATNDSADTVKRAAINDLGRLASVDSASALVDVLQFMIEQKDEYLIGQTTLALTLATGKTLGENVEGWRHLVADLRKAEDEKKAEKGPEVKRPDPPSEEPANGGG